MGLSEAAKSSIVFVLASLLTQGLHFITTPIYTRIMSTSDMGVATAYSSYTSIIGTIIGAGLCSGAFSIAMNEYRGYRDEYTASNYVLSFLIALPFGLFATIFRKELSGVMRMPSGLIVLMALSFALSPATSMWLSKNRFEYKYKYPFIVTCLSSVLSVIASIFFLIYFKNQDDVDLAVVRLVSTSAVQLSVAAVLAVIILKKSKSIINLEYWKFGLLTGLPMVIHSLAKTIFDGSDRIMILHLDSASAAGKYGVLYSFSSISVIIWTAINGSLVPYIFNGIRENDTKRIYKLTRSILFIYFLICIILMLIAPELVRLLATEEYLSAIYVVPPIAAGIFFTALYNMYSTVVLYHKKTTYIMMATVVSALVNVVLNYFFIKRFGYIAAAYTTLVAFIVLSVTQFLAMIKVHRTDIYDEKIFVALSATIVISTGMVNILYKSYALRYMVIITIMLLLVLYRKTIQSTILSLKSDKYEQR